MGAYGRYEVVRNAFHYDVVDLWENDGPPYHGYKRVFQTRNREAAHAKARQLQKEQQQRDTREGLI